MQFRIFRSRNTCQNVIYKPESISSDLYLLTYHEKLKQSNMISAHCPGSWKYFYGKQIFRLLLDDHETFYINDSNSYINEFQIRGINMIIFLIRPVNHNLERDKCIANTCHFKLWMGHYWVQGQVTLVCLVRTIKAIFPMSFVLGYINK